MNVSKEDVAGRVWLRGLTAQDDFRLERSPLWRNKRKLSENVVAGKVLFKPLVNDHVRCDDQIVCGQVGVGHPLTVKIGPNYRHSHDPSFAGAGSHLEGEAPEILGR